ncbi:hypothetical protein [Mycoplasma sp. HU2014]|uniref:hypothetical protein n=1 Tax=Mycoplasma sp. HU2014 TaxID=1664275 RepID=UPI00067AAA48|nr:hypothetical protein [Mycoplasma sp. HU2014]KNG79785.1 hypothetical protein AB668_02235 [Mycoplasma sp. HU2014]
MSDLLSEEFIGYRIKNKQSKTKKVCISLSKPTVELEEKLSKKLKESNTGFTFNRSRIYHEALLNLLEPKQ